MREQSSFFFFFFFLAGVPPQDPSAKSMMLLSICFHSVPNRSESIFFLGAEILAEMHPLCKRLHLGISTSFSRVDIKNPMAFMGHKSHAVVTCYTCNNNRMIRSDVLADIVRVLLLCLASDGVFDDRAATSGGM